MTSKAYRDGQNFFKISPSYFKNPFSCGSKESQDFERGYYQRFRLSPTLANNNCDDSRFYYREVNGKFEKIKSVAEEEAIDAYRNRKGE